MVLPRATVGPQSPSPTDRPAQHWWDSLFEEVAEVRFEGVLAVARHDRDRRLEREVCWQPERHLEEAWLVKRVVGAKQPLNVFCESNV